MSRIPKNHDHLYFDKLIRTNKAESLLSMIQATYHARNSSSDDQSFKSKVAERLEYAYRLFRDDVRGSNNGSGTYSGESSQFESQYTFGLEMGIWINSNLELSDLALKVAENRITVRDYFDIVMLNYFQPVNNLIVHPLYLILSYMNEKKIKCISSLEVAEAFNSRNINCNNEGSRLIMNFLVATNYFDYDGEGYKYVFDYPLEILLESCNIEYVEKGYDIAKIELEDDRAYYKYLTEDHRPNSKTEKETDIIDEKYSEDELVLLYQNWLTSRLNRKASAASKYTGYGNCLKKICYYLISNNHLNCESILDLDMESCEKAYQICCENEEVKTYDKTLGNYGGRASLGLYKPFLEQVKCFGFLVVKKAVEEQYSLEELEQCRVNSTRTTDIGYNKIFYGIPGCGKSYKVSAMLAHEKEFVEEAKKNKIYNPVDEMDIIRTTFYLDYTNSDFVGQIYPVVGDKGVTYEYIPGPFTNALIKAFKNPGKMIYLIIEEINRGNAAAIFGDIFQLLDRLKVEKYGRLVGDSEYPIDNDFIMKCLNKEGVYLDKVYIPSNLTIFATMNTSDQNVFPLDNAFKRRWERERVVSDWDKCGFKEKIIPYTDITWEEFAIGINRQIIAETDKGIVTEDKQMGAFFAKEEMFIDKEKQDEIPDEDKNQKLLSFTNNVLEYLYCDVTKFEHSVLFNKNLKSFDDVVTVVDEIVEEKQVEKAKAIMEMFNEQIKFKK